MPCQLAGLATPLPLLSLANYYKTMRTLTSMEQRAAECRYPATFDDYTPNQDGYWWEPGLLCLPIQPKQVAFTADGRVLYQFREVGDSKMAPRFRPGTLLGIERIVSSAALQPGAIYMFQAADEDDPMGPNWMPYGLARLVAHTPDFALFEYDNGGQLITRPLLWHEDFFRLYRVSHYIYVPPVVPVSIQTRSLHWPALAQTVPGKEAA